MKIHVCQIFYQSDFFRFGWLDLINSSYFAKHTAEIELSRRARRLTSGDPTYVNRANFETLCDVGKVTRHMVLMATQSGRTLLDQRCTEIFVGGGLPSWSTAPGVPIVGMRSAGAANCVSKSVQARRPTNATGDFRFAGIPSKGLLGIDPGGGTCAVRFAPTRIPRLRIRDRPRITRRSDGVGIVRPAVPVSPPSSAFSCAS